VAAPSSTPTFFNRRIPQPSPPCIEPLRPVCPAYAPPASRRRTAPPTPPLVVELPPPAILLPSRTPEQIPLDSRKLPSPASPSFPCRNVAGAMLLLAGDLLHAGEPLPVLLPTSQDHPKLALEPLSLFPQGALAAGDPTRQILVGRRPYSPPCHEVQPRTYLRNKRT